jgi:protein gp37
MAEATNISWTDSTFNPWIGCTAVSEGCDHCYAEALDHRWGGDHWGKGKQRRVTVDSYWTQPLKWDATAARLGITTKVFCASLADVMDDEAPKGQRERLWHLIDSTPNLIWQLLTKRPQRYDRHLPYRFVHDNVWLGASTENQKNYDLRWPYLRNVAEDRGLTTFVSYEPAVGPLTLMNGTGVPDWLICGGESGHGRREMDQKWAENIQKECREQSVKFFMKQMSAVNPNKGAALIPAHLLVRDFPDD